MNQKYHIRYRKRDGMNSPWELYIDKDLHDRFLLKQAQDITDRLWDEGNETMMSAVGTEWDNAT